MDNRPPLLGGGPTVLNRLRNRLNGEEGFTLIELLVVILIIGILAAIAIPSFLNQKGKGVDASAKSDARAAATAMETYYTDRGNYSGADVDALEDIEPSLNDASGLTVTPTAGGDGYAVQTTGGDGRTFRVIKAAD